MFSYVEVLEKNENGQAKYFEIFLQFHCKRKLEIEFSIIHLKVVPNKFIFLLKLCS